MTAGIGVPSSTRTAELYALMFAGLWAQHNSVLTLTGLKKTTASTAVNFESNQFHFPRSGRCLQW